MKTTVVSPANIAFIKYWGLLDPQIFLPANGSLSMNLDSCVTTVTVDFLEQGDEDLVEVGYHGQDFVKFSPEGADAKKKLLFDHIQRIKDLAGESRAIYIRSQNNFPASAGIASSASAFSAITYALVAFYKLEPYLSDRKELSKLIRLGGSVSAMRSSHDGFVECVYGKDHDGCYSNQLADETYWDLVDIVAVVSAETKKVSSSQGHSLTSSSPFYESRLSHVPERLEKIKTAIENKDFSKLGEYIEEDAVSMHSVMMTSKPAIFYWTPETMEVIHAIREWRESGEVESYFTIDAGANVHVIAQGKDAQNLEDMLNALPGVKFTILNHPSKGARISDNHLF